MLLTTSPFVKTYTLDEFWELPEPSGRRKLELIRGVLYMVPPPDEKVHDPIVSRLAHLLFHEMDRLGDKGQLLFPRSGLWTFYPDTWLEPDLFYVSKETQARFNDKPRSSADLVIEVLSPSSADYDRTTKADTYAALGVKELWLVDPETRTVQVRVNSGKEWGAPSLFHEGEQLSSGVLPGLQISVSSIFADPV